MGEIKLCVKHFSQLSTEELFEIYKLRVSVFVVEQKCAYQEVDDADKAAYHMWLEDDGGIAAYIRILPAGVTYDSASIGRVISVRRRLGYASKLLSEGMAFAKKTLNADRLTIGAQTYAVPLYEKVGFKISSEPYIEDGIEHVHMTADI